MMNTVSSIGILKTPAFLKSLTRLYFYLRTSGKRRKENKRMISMEELLETLSEEYLKAEIQGDSEKMKIFNTGIYIITIEYDVAIMKQMMPSQIETWGQQIVGRQWVILMYEAMNDLLRLNGKDFQKSLIKGLPNEEELLDERKRIMAKLNTFKKNHENRLSELRNYCGAHRDKNAHEQLKHIRSITISELAGMATEFMIPVVMLSSFYREVMKSMTNSRLKKRS